jgi:hypothetical protein
MGVARSLLIVQAPVNPKQGKTAMDLAASQLREDVSPESFETFDFLGQHGVLVEVPAAFESVGMRMPYLYACVLLPSRQGVWVMMTGPHVFLPADLELFKHVLRSMREVSGEGRGVTDATDPQGVGAGQGESDHLGRKSAKSGLKTRDMSI